MRDGSKTFLVNLLGLVDELRKNVVRVCFLTFLLYCFIRGAIDLVHDIRAKLGNPPRGERVKLSVGQGIEFAYPMNHHINARRYDEPWGTVIYLDSLPKSEDEQ